MGVTTYARKSILWSMEENNFVLLNHYAKKKDETDPRQIERALSLLDDWYERKGK